MSAFDNGVIQASRRIRYTAWASTAIIWLLYGLSLLSPASWITAGMLLFLGIDFGCLLCVTIFAWSTQ